MRKGTIWALVATAILMLAIAVSSAALSFFMWALALNGFMGQDRAVNISLITFVVLLAVFSLVCLGLSLLSVYYLSAKRNWNAAGAAALSTVAFTVAIVALDFLAIFISVMVASQLRTTR